MEIINGDKFSIIHHPKKETTPDELKSLEDLAKSEEDFRNKGIRLVEGGVPRNANVVPRFPPLLVKLVADESTHHAPRGCGVKDRVAACSPLPRYSGGEGTG